LAAEIIDIVDPVVEKNDSVRETQDCNEIVRNDQHLAVEQNMKIHAQGDDKKLRPKDVGSGVGREMGYGDFCFRRLLGSDRPISYSVEETGKQEWSYEDFEVDSGNARFKEIVHFERCHT
jgi:hypothetical protein